MPSARALTRLELPLQVYLVGALGPHRTIDSGGAWCTLRSLSICGSAILRPKRKGAASHSTCDTEERRGLLCPIAWLQSTDSFVPSPGRSCQQRHSWDIGRCACTCNSKIVRILLKAPSLMFHRVCTVSA
eukprot:6203422-Pleurochrysis_carterae.AAC.2